MGTLETHHYDVIIIGGALTGLTLAVGLAMHGIRVAVVEARDPAVVAARQSDGRTSAITYGSSRILQRYGLWQSLEAKAGNILDIRIADYHSSQGVHYDHRLVGNVPMGYIVENHTLLCTLLEKARSHQNITFYAPATYSDITVQPQSVMVHLNGGIRLCGKVLIGADGRDSALRTRFNIPTITHSYPQDALIFNIHHEHEHRGVAEERFLPHGPLAVLPMYDPHLSSIVWTEKKAEASLLLSMPEEECLALLQRALGDSLGNIRLASERFAYPLTLVHAKAYTACRFALIGDAAHCIHPLAGQGFNLGIRDVDVVVALMAEQLQLGLDVGSAMMLERYARLRLSDNTLMMVATDLLNRLFSNSLPGLVLARQTAMAIVNKSSFAKRHLIRHAMGITLFNRTSESV